LEGGNTKVKSILIQKDIAGIKHPLSDTFRLKFSVAGEGEVSPVLPMHQRRLITKITSYQSQGG